MHYRCQQMCPFAITLHSANGKRDFDVPVAVPSEADNVLILEQRTLREELGVHMRWLLDATIEKKDVFVGRVHAVRLAKGGE